MSHENLPRWGEGMLAAYFTRKGILADPNDPKWDHSWTPSLTSFDRVFFKIVGYPAVGTVTKGEHDRIAKHGLAGLFAGGALSIVSINPVIAAVASHPPVFARTFAGAAAGITAGIVAPYLGILAGNRIGVWRVRRQRQAKNG